MHGYMHPRWNDAFRVVLMSDGTLLLVWRGVHSRKLVRVLPHPPKCGLQSMPEFLSESDDACRDILRDIDDVLSDGDD